MQQFRRRGKRYAYTRKYAGHSKLLRRGVSNITGVSSLASLILTGETPTTGSLNTNFISARASARSGDEEGGGETADFEIHWTHVYFLPVRSQLNCSLFVLFNGQSTERNISTFIVRSHSRFRPRYSAILFRFRSPSARCKCVQRALVLSSSSSLLSVIFASGRKVRRRRQLHKWQMQKRRSVSRALCAHRENKSPTPPIYFHSRSMVCQRPRFPSHYYPLFITRLVRKHISSTSSIVPPVHLTHGCFGVYPGQL